MTAAGERLALAGRIRCARVEAGLTQQQVADAARIGRVAVADAEAGRRRVAVDEGVRLARVLGVQLAELLDMPAGDAQPDAVRHLIIGLTEAQVALLAEFAQFLLWRRARGPLGPLLDHGQAGARETRCHA